MFGGGGFLFGTVKGLAPKVLLKQATLQHKLKRGTYLILVCNPGRCMGKVLGGGRKEHQAALKVWAPNLN